MPTAKVGDINLYYEVHGKGEPLVLIMGYTGHGGQFGELRDRLSKGCRVIVPDNRGTGRSDKPDMPYTAKMMAADIADLLDALEIDAASVLGYSMGGMIAQEFALSYPDRLKNLILAGTTHGGPKTILPGPEGMALLLGPEYIDIPPEEFARALVPQLWDDDFVERNPADVNAYIARVCEYPTPPHAIKSHRNVLVSHDAFEHLRDIKVPTLVITGNRDILMPCENSKILTERIPNAELVMIENAGHGVFISDPTGQVSKIILDFLRRHSKAHVKN